MDCDDLAIAVHVLTLSAGFPDYCASGEVVCNWDQAQESLLHRADSNTKKWTQFVWAYGGILSTLITATAIGQKSTGKST